MRRGCAFGVRRRGVRGGLGGSGECSRRTVRTRGGRPRGDVRGRRPRGRKPGLHPDKCFEIYHTLLHYGPDDDNENL